MIFFITSRRGLQGHTLLQWHSSYDILLTIGRENRVCSFSQGPAFKTRSFVNETCFVCACVKLLLLKIFPFFAEKNVRNFLVLVQKLLIYFNKVY